MGIKGTVRRNQDGHFIHANIDLDIIITEEVRVSNLHAYFWEGGREGGREEKQSTVNFGCIEYSVAYYMA